MKIAVVGVGNVLMGDEGVGIVVVEELKRRNVDVDLHDCGTMGLDILNTISEYDKVIIVDAVKGFGMPGDVVRVSLENIECGRILCLHDINIPFILKLAESIVKIPEIVIIGIEVERIGEGLGLSESVKNAVEKAVELVLEEIERFKLSKDNRKK